MARSDSKFQIEGLPADPEQLLAQIFQECIDQTIEAAQKKRIYPDRLGMIISSQLLDRDIWIPIREITPNTLDTILNRFLHVAQSKSQEGNLWGAPFVVKVMVVDHDALPKKQQISGRGSKYRKLAHVHHKLGIDSVKALIKVKNDDHLCLFYALQLTKVYASKAMTTVQFSRYYRGLYGLRNWLRDDVSSLMNRLKIPADMNGGYDAEKFVPMIVDYWNSTDPEHKYKVFIFGDSGHYKPLYTYGSEDYNTPLVLYYSKDHFDGVRCINLLFGKLYCLACESIFNGARDHSRRCPILCLKCGRHGVGFPCKADPSYKKWCQNCEKTFNNRYCFEHHKKSGECLRSRQCPQCHVIWSVKDNTRGGRKGHVCVERFCKLCQRFHNPETGCFIQPLQPKKQLPYRLVFFDLETMQHEQLSAEHPDRWPHKCNFVSAKVVCTECIATERWDQPLVDQKACEICGPNRRVTFSQRPFQETTVDYQEVALNPLRQFVRWLLSLPAAYTTLAISHFGGRFDMVLTFRELYLLGHIPDLIHRGNKMYEMAVRGTRLNPETLFHDSYNVTPMALGDLPAAFGLNIEEKQFFPHLANKTENYDKILPDLPSPTEYLADGMKPEKRQLFDRWYSENKEQPFNLNEKLAEYCVNDTEILCAAMLKFRSEFIEISKRENHHGIDILRQAMTIASGCMKHFRLNHLPPGHLGIVPERGYDTADTQSLLALKFLRWFADTNNVKVRTANSEGGEQRIPKTGGGEYRLDGYIEEWRMGLEVHGCVWHACRKHFPEDTTLLPCGKTAGKVRERDEARTLELNKALDGRLQIYWECEIREMLDNPAYSGMRQAFDNYLDEGPIRIRDAYAGGRTGPFKLYHKAGPGEKISYYDFTSLYPYTNFVTNYPIGHPKVHIKNEDICWTRAKDNPYKLAILKVFVVPPRKIAVPVLPVHFDLDDRLLFTTCRECSLTYSKGKTMEHYNCEHTDAERGWISTCTSIELDAALAEGYRVTKLVRVLEYADSDNTLFRGYISEFYSQKLHSSGFPQGIDTPEKEQRFIDESKERFNITVDRKMMISNKSRRSLSKLMNNNLWGRFSLRNKMSKTHITNNPAVMCRFLNDRQIEVMALHELTPDVVMISYIPIDEFIEKNDWSNIIVSLWTTSQARLILLKTLQKVARTPGCTILYTDTDSIIFVHPIDKNPLETGPHLGDLADEFPKHNILEYCSGGSKQYGLKLQRSGTTNDFEYVLKLRGISLTQDVVSNQGLCYERFKESVLKYCSEGFVDPIYVSYPRFLRPSIKDGSVISLPFRKIYRPYVAKGIVTPDYFVRHFGYTTS